ncbi:hypothetical protein GS896_27590 [Rhodococcus hoagii]|nr:hypothetical protein [Prescottella equi]MBM4654016.1 hypothetical protein [Prescottella equi]NKR23518.1 hypothetical protein [Prescottella equi]NKT56328.1 hypothetical protein [Prescottella equi]NKU37511.1 hypothetical protein [Prescottella equi]
MPTFRIRVHEEFTTEYDIEAPTEDEARDEAIRRNTDNPGDPSGSVILCDRTAEIVTFGS